MAIKNFIRALENHSTRVGIIVGLVAIVFVATVSNLQSCNTYCWYRLAMFGRSSAARVVAIDRRDHNTCRFEYTVNSRQYLSSEQGCHFNVGERITIHYLPDEPSIGTSADPLSELVQMIIFPLIAGLISGSAFAAQLRRSRRRLANRSEKHTHSK